MDMKYTVRTLQKYHIAYGLLPYKRNQDVIRVHEFGDGKYAIAVTDGWNRPDAFPNDEPGKWVASFVADEYPNAYRLHGLGATNILEERIAEKYPRLATCVASFVFHFVGDDTIVSVGDLETYVWDSTRWYKPKEISDHALDLKTYESNVARFFGAREHKRDPRFPGIFSADPDVLEISSTTPVLIATDGIKDVLPIGDLNALPVNPAKRSAKEIVETILNEVIGRGTQRDDISLLLRLKFQFLGDDSFGGKSPIMKDMRKI